MPTRFLSITSPP